MYLQFVIIIQVITAFSVEQLQSASIYYLLQYATVTNVDHYCWSYYHHIL